MEPIKLLLFQGILNSISIIFKYFNNHFYCYFSKIIISVSLKDQNFRHLYDYILEINVNSYTMQILRE